MAITTSIARHYAVRLIVMTIVMLVLGLWGVYDYFLAIPAQQRAFERYQAISLTQRALQPDLQGDALTQATSDATAAVEREIDLLLDDHAERTGLDRAAMDQPNWRAMMIVQMGEGMSLPEGLTSQPAYADAQRVVESLREANAIDWIKGLLLFEQALAQPRAPGGGLNQQQQSVYSITEQQMNAIAKDEVPTPPSTFDRITQIAFISCLLGVPYLLMAYLATIRRVYRLDDDGALHTPEGDWPAEQIADIDMSRWMAKSIAHVVHTDGRRIMLDDYKHRDMHRIVGGLAHRFYPEEWTEEAKPVKKEAPEDEAEASAEAEQAAVDAVFEGEEERV